MSIIEGAREVRRIVTEAALGLVAAVGAPASTPDLVPNPNGNGAVFLRRSGYTLEQLSGAKVPVPAHAFTDVAALADHLNRHADPAVAHILLDGALEIVVADLDPGDPVASKVTCELATHPRFARWAGVFGRALRQKQLLHLCIAAEEDFAPVRSREGDVLGTQSGQLSSQLRKFSAARKMDVEVELDETGATRFVGKAEKVTVSGTLPSRFTVQVPMFVGVKMRDPGLPKPPPGTELSEREWVEATYALEVLLRVEVGDHGPSFHLECPSLPVVRHQALQDAASFLRGRLADGFLVGIGRFDITQVTAPFIG